MFKVNEYFEGKVKSIGFKTAEGPATVGVMAVGEYTFGTSTVEIMQVVSGSLSVLLPGQSTWTFYGPGSTFRVEAKATFKVKAEAETAYLCLYRQAISRTV